MAEADKKEEGAEKAEAPSKKGKKGLLIAVGIVLVVLAIGVPVVLLMGKNDKKEESSKSAEKVHVDISTFSREQALQAEAEEELAEGEEVLGALVPMDPFVLNLKGGRFVKLQLQVEFVERDIPKKFLQRVAIIRDGIITLVNNRSSEDVLEREGKEKLRKDIRNVINEVLRKELVKRVYFTQFVVQ